MASICNLQFSMVNFQFPPGAPPGITGAEHIEKNPCIYSGCIIRQEFFFRVAQFCAPQVFVRLALAEDRNRSATTCSQIAVSDFFPDKDAATHRHNATCVRDTFMHDRRHPYASTYAYAKLHFVPFVPPPARGGDRGGASACFGAQQQHGAIARSATPATHNQCQVVHAAGASIPGDRSDLRHPTRHSHNLSAYFDFTSPAQFPRGGFSNSSKSADDKKIPAFFAESRIDKWHRVAPLEG